MMTDAVEFELMFVVVLASWLTVCCFYASLNRIQISTSTGFSAGVFVSGRNLLNAANMLAVQFFASFDYVMKSEGGVKTDESHRLQILVIIQLKTWRSTLQLFWNETPH